MTASQGVGIDMTTVVLIPALSAAALNLLSWYIGRKVAAISTELGIWKAWATGSGLRMAGLAVFATVYLIWPAPFALTENESALALLLFFGILAAGIIIELVLTLRKVRLNEEENKAG